MIVLGTTSFGNKIYVDWQTDEDGKRTPKFPIFVNQIETYQAMVVFEALMLGENADRFPNDQADWLDIGNIFYENQLISQHIQLDDIEATLGITNSLQRLRYARIFIRPEWI